MKHISLFITATALLMAPVLSAAAKSAEMLDGPIVDELRTGQNSGDQRFDHSTFDALLKQFADPDAGTVDYAGLAEHRDALNRYLQSLADVDLTGLSGAEQLALLLNAYNACTLDLILNHYPDIDSIRDISNPWTTERCGVGGHTLTLDEIEHNLIRPMFRDPRIHFAVNCAAVDCPPLADFAFTGPDVVDQLQERTEATLSDERFVNIESRWIRSDRLRYTRVMHWYDDDFVDDIFRGHASTIAEYISRHTRNDEIRRFIDEHDGDPPASAMSYDWSLNDVE